MDPTLVRHRPRKHLISNQEFCVICGGLGHYFLIDDDDPSDCFTVDCKSMECARPERAGVPPSTPAATTDKIEIFYEEEEGPRGICFGRGGIVTRADALSGDIIVSGRRKTK